MSLLNLKLPPHVCLLNIVNQSPLMKKNSKTHHVKMDEFEENPDEYHWWETAQDYDTEVEFFPEEDVLLPKTDSRVLNQCDYNLNSPLLMDHVDSLASGIRSGQAGGRYRKNTFFEKQIRSAHLGGSITPLRGGTGFHSWVAQEVFQKEVRSSHFQEFLSGRDDHALEVMKLVHAFWKGLTGEPLKSTQESLRLNLLRSPHPTEEVRRLKSDGEAFWFFYRVTLCMNSRNEEERKALLESGTDWKLQLLERREEDLFLFTGQHPDWGNFRIGPGFLILESPRRLLDRNMVLMIKDTMIGRFAGKLSQAHRERSGFQEELLKKMTKLLALGDQIMAKRGNDVFDVLQLLEPHCNQRLADLAWQFRPRIPRDSKFEEFLEKEVRNLEMLGEGPVTTFFNHIRSETSWEVVLRYYGMFRLWGHPFINYLEGLRKLHYQVTLPKIVDTQYAECLASDLAYKVLKHEFDIQKKWFVDASLLEPTHILYHHIRECTWPTQDVLDRMGDTWHKLPLVQCYEVPATIDPSVILADKSHSPNRSEVINHVKERRQGPIPSRKVLQTALNTPQRDVRKFLSTVNDEGLPRDSLVIGLKGKEREIKKNGRFFALMSWDLREYFVMTEYLIKTFYVPLFQGLTMADDLKSVTKKILRCTLNQGLNSYKGVSFANHVDYEKWNNHQRKEATDPVFRVMGQFLGMPELFYRTHEFFQKSLVYYGERPDLMEVRSDSLYSLGSNVVVWNGQAGGLEGLRQKGWSVVNLLVILRESQIRNTEVLTLAQGDNQVICSQYSLSEGLEGMELDEELSHIFWNNHAIMEGIRKGTEKLGLIINQKETLTSSDYLTYGKVPVVRGCIQPHEIKRYARVTCIPNDQIPSLGNSLSTVGTSSLTVAQFDVSILEPLICYVVFGFLVVQLHLFHSPLLNGPMRPHVTRAELTFLIRALFLDPSLGGVSGTSPTRFLIRQFPDPVTESLVFWKLVYNHTDSHLIRDIALQAGEPKLARSTFESISKLIEKPTSLNLPKGLSAPTLVKNEVRKWLLSSRDSIRNETVREAVMFVNSRGDSVLSFLKSINPLFPRFLSEFAAGTFLGLTENVVGLFQNSRTIRSSFSGKFRKEISQLLVRSEFIAATILSRPARPFLSTIWECSSKLADLLRERSWGQPVKGTTVPHPLEMVGLPTEGGALCRFCPREFPFNEYLTVCYPKQFQRGRLEKGPLAPYLGSATSESTSMFQPWEKAIQLPLIEKALRLRTAINWFVHPQSNVARAILTNLKSLTGQDWTEEDTAFSRTGSALHRFRSPRQGNGGFSAVSPTGISWTLVTADTMPEIGKENYDFMYQALMLYGQTVSLEVVQGLCHPVYRHHFHIQCTGCLRRIEEISLDTTMVLELPDVSSSVVRLSGGVVPSIVQTPGVSIPQGNWESLSGFTKCFHLGVGIGSFFGILSVDNDPAVSEGILFPISLVRRMSPYAFLIGILQGLLMAASYEAIYRRMTAWRVKPGATVRGCCNSLISLLSKDLTFVAMIGQEHFFNTLVAGEHRVPPSFPASPEDLGSIGRSFLLRNLVKRTVFHPLIQSRQESLWIFSDFKTPKSTGTLILSHRLWHLLRGEVVTAASLDEVRAIKDVITYYAARERLFSVKPEDRPATLIYLGKHIRSVKWCPKEMRQAAQDVPISLAVSPPQTHSWGPEFVCGAKETRLDFSNLDQDPLPYLVIPRLTDPLISGLRLGQLATGAHYKIRPILDLIGGFNDVLVGGDGSGGMTAAILRWSPSSRAIFNSLMAVEGRQFKGVAPGPPSALLAMGEHIRSRCVNVDTAWKEPSDLREDGTWQYFLSLKHEHQMLITLMVFDMEVTSLEDIRKIGNLAHRYLDQLLELSGHLVFKLYGTLEYQTRGELVTLLGKNFRSTSGVWTDLTSSHSSEFYLVCKGRVLGRSHLSKVTTRSLQELLESLPALKTTEAEFQRSLVISPRKMLDGIPPCLLPSPEVEWIGILTRLGVVSGIAVELAEVTVWLTGSKIPPYAALLMNLIVIANFIVPITKWTQGEYQPPSDQALIRLCTAFVAIWEFNAWKHQVLAWRIQITPFLMKYVHWSFRTMTRESLQGQKNGVEWDWFEPTWSKKVLPKAVDSALAGHIIRIATRLFANTRNDHSLEWLEMMKFMSAHLSLFNKGLNPMDTIRHTGLWLPLLGHREVRSSLWEEPLTGEALPEPDQSNGHMTSWDS